jgi:hypothetical protein
MKHSNNQRKTFLIHREFQLSFIKHMLVLTLCVIAIFYAANLYHFWTLKQQGLSLGLPSTHVFFRFIREQQHTMDLLFLITSTAAMLTIIGFGLFLSHRVAGPLHRLKKYLESEDSFESTSKPLKFRDGDYFGDIAAALNERLAQDKKTLRQETDS